MERICFFNTAIAWGGGEKWHFEVSQYLWSKGYQILVVAHQKSILLQKLKKTNIPHEVVSSSNLSFLNPLMYHKMVQLLKKHQIGTLVLNLSRDLKLAGPSARKAGIPRIIYRRGSAIPIKNTVLNRYYFNKVITEILANSVATQKTILQKNKDLFPQEKIKVIYNGVQIPQNIANYHHQQKKEFFTIITLGRLEYQKNQAFLIDVAQILKDEGMNFKMIIGGEGRLRTTLEEKVKDLGLINEIVLPGFINDPLKFISQGDVFVLPSHWEGFGYVLAEASLCKKPIVAFKVSSNTEVVVDQKTGFLTKTDDADAFAKAIIHLNKNKKEAQAMGEAGYLHVQKNFEKEQQLRTIEKYLVHGS